jgi:hypothetical protein
MVLRDGAFICSQLCGEENTNDEALDVKLKRIISSPLCTMQDRKQVHTWRASLTMNGGAAVACCSSLLSTAKIAIIIWASCAAGLHCKNRSSEVKETRILNDSIP